MARIPADQIHMMRTLLFKELRTLRPFAWLIVGLLVLIVAYTCATEFPDSNPLVPAHWLEHDASGELAFLMLFGLIIGAGLLVNESEQGTLTFLDALPVSRTRIFIAKMVAGLLVLSLASILCFGIDVVLGLISRTSMS